MLPAALTVTGLRVARSAIAGMLRVIDVEDAHHRAGERLMTRTWRRDVFRACRSAQLLRPNFDEQVITGERGRKSRDFARHVGHLADEIVDVVVSRRVVVNGRQDAHERVVAFGRRVAG